MYNSYVHVFYRQLLDAIVNTVNSSNIKNFCSILDCEPKCDQLVHSIVKYYSTCLVINSTTCDDTQLDLLIKTLAENEYLNKADCNKIRTEAKNKKACFLNVLHTKPITFSFLECLVESLQPIQLEIYRKMAEIKDDIREIENLHCKRKLSKSHFTNINVTDALRNYQTSLKKRYENLPEISKQGWYDDGVKKQFVNVTMVKSLERDGNDVEDFFSPEHSIEGEVVYDSRHYVYHDEIFQIDSTTHKLLAII